MEGLSDESTSDDKSKYSKGCLHNSSPKIATRACTILSTMALERQRKELTAFQKGQIEGRASFMSHAEIGDELGIPCRTVSSFLERVKTRHTINNFPHPGAPRKTSAADDRYIVRTTESETRIPLAELRIQTNLDVSEQTLRRRLHEEGIRKWKAVNRPLLTKEHAAKRLKWAKAHQHWMRKDWEKVAWSDECAVQRDSNPRKVWVFRRQNDSEKYAPKNIRGKAKGGGVSQMIWSCFMGNKLGPITFIDGSVNIQVYINVPVDSLLPFIDALNADSITDIVFQQDNASCHTSKKTTQFLELSMNQHGFSVMKWPPNSPDMNPIEHIWAHLKTELHRRYPDTAFLRGSPDTVRRVLQKRLMEIWWDIGAGVLNTLIDSMLRRVHALLAAGGWYTDY